MGSLLTSCCSADKAEVDHASHMDEFLGTFDLEKDPSLIKRMSQKIGRSTKKSFISHGNGTYTHTKESMAQATVVGPFYLDQQIANSENDNMITFTIQNHRLIETHRSKGVDVKVIEYRRQGDKLIEETTEVGGSKPSHQRIFNKIS